MITGLYQGGLGNQMFQVAIGLILAHDNNDTYAINPTNFIGCGAGNPIGSYIKTIFRNIPTTDYKSNDIYQESSESCHNIPYRNNICLKGFFQNYIYYKNYRNLLLDSFVLSKESVNLNNTKHLLTIHIRLGDYLKHSHFNLLTKQYISNCLSLLDLSNYQIIILSDSPDKIPHYVENIEYTVMNCDESIALYILSESDVVISSNSTFSWWGSYLGKSKKVFVPNKWNTNGNLSEIYRDDMIKIDL